jgi:DNA-binding GntR family transcriptional regulator
MITLATEPLEGTFGFVIMTWVQIAAWLRGRMEAGEFRPGEDSLPCEKDLQELFEVSRDTARRAVGQLWDEGLVVTGPRRGTYVVPRT